MIATYKALHIKPYFNIVFRKVQNESATGSSTSSRVRTTLTIRVETIDFDTQACMLRLKGRNIEENQYVKVGLSTFLSTKLSINLYIKTLSISKMFGISTLRKMV